MDFANGQFVESGSGYRTGWGVEEAMDPSTLEGTWSSHDGESEDKRKFDLDREDTQVGRMLLYFLRILIASAPAGSLTFRSENLTHFVTFPQALLFPTGIHAFAVKKDSGEMIVELGWMVDKDTR